MNRVETTDPLEAKRRFWERLDELLRRVERHGFSALRREELNELGRLHRRVSAHLAQAQSGISDPAVVRYLNRLVVRSHGLIYRTHPKIAWSAIGRFFTRGFPETVYRCWVYLAISLVIFYGAGLLAFAVAYAHTEYTRLFLSPCPGCSSIDPQDWEAMIEELSHGSPGGLSLVSSALMMNNVRVGILAFGGGILFGALTLYALVGNGLMLGGFAALMHDYGGALRFWSFVLPHGVFELTAISICGAAGLRLAAPLIAPGPYRRKEALVAAAPDALRMAVGTIPLFVIAAPIEAFLSPKRVPVPVTLLFSMVCAAALMAYFAAPFVRGLAGHLATRAEPPP